MIVIQILLFLVLLYGVFGFAVKMLKITKKDSRGNPLGGQFLQLPIWKYALFGGGLLWIITLCIIRVGAQEVGVVITPTGVSETEQHTGWHVIAPWNDLETMDKTVWVYTCAHSTTEGQKTNSDAIWAPTKDGIKMGFDVSVSWRIIPDEASWIYANVTENEGPNGRYMWLEENVIRTKLKSAMALTVSNYTPIEAYSTKRQDIQDKVMQKMRAECTQYRLTIDQVDLREVFYNPDYEKSINAKKLAEQEALRLIEVTKQKEEQLKQASIDKDMAIQTAQGEAEALKIKGEAINQNPKIVDLKWIEKWDGSLPTYMLGQGQGVMLNLQK